MLRFIFLVFLSLHNLQSVKCRPFDSHSRFARYDLQVLRRFLCECRRDVVPLGQNPIFEPSNPLARIPVTAQRSHLGIDVVKDESREGRDLLGSFRDILQEPFRFEPSLRTEVKVLEGKSRDNVVEGICIDTSVASKCEAGDVGEHGEEVFEILMIVDSEEGEPAERFWVRNRSD